MRPKASQVIGINTYPISEILFQKMKAGTDEDKRTRLFPSSITDSAAVPKAKIRCEVLWKLRLQTNMPKAIVMKVQKIDGNAIKYSDIAVLKKSLHINFPRYYKVMLLIVDTSLLDSDYAIHFDLYNTKLKSNGDIDVTQFAPFSHDAQGCTNCVPVSDSEPSTLILLSPVLVSLGLWVRWDLGGI